MIGYLPIPYHAARWAAAGGRGGAGLPGLGPLLAGVEIRSSRGDLSRSVSGIVIDSRRAAAGVVFFALAGHRTDGARFIDEAIARGAVAVVSAHRVALAPAHVAVVEVADPRRALAVAARRFYGAPDEALAVAGITGTNGKTTTAYLVRAFLAAAGLPAGLLGTISYDLGRRTVPAFRTTPESVDVFGLLAQMREAGLKSAVMEVSSHGLVQDRVHGLRFASAAFLNLTRDHLDYHRDLDSYFEAKLRLFTGATGRVPGAAVVNLDDPRGRAVLERVPEGVRRLTFSARPEAGADLAADRVRLAADGAAFVLRWPGGGEAGVRSPLVGAYNVSNVLAATAVALSLGADPAAFLPALARFPGVPGRMEPVRGGQPFPVFVDYAHTDDALRNALGMLRAVTPGRLLVVFGCGGNRDRSKRPLMTRAVQEAADLAWATADNPRLEDLAGIFDDMRAGVTDPERIVFVEDRREAISRALDAARAGDAVLIAGKGHETYQEAGGAVVPFDDRAVARELLAIKGHGAGPAGASGPGGGGGEAAP